jgi:signal peptidase I
VNPLTRLCTRITVLGAFGLGAVRGLDTLLPSSRDPGALAPEPGPVTVAESEAQAHAPRMGALRWSRRVVVYGVLGAGTALILAVFVPFLMGMRSYTVMSGSMEPAIDTGDVVVERSLTPEEIRPGDVVTFRDPTRANRLITHRVRQVSIAAGVVHVVTRGDANTGFERWSVPIKGHVGLVVYRLPRIGYVAHAIGGTMGHLLFVVLPILLIGLTLLIDVWRPNRSQLGAPAEVAS